MHPSSECGNTFGDRDARLAVTATVVFGHLNVHFVLLSPIFVRLLFTLYPVGLCVLIRLFLQYLSWRDCGMSTVDMSFFFSRL